MERLIRKTTAQQVAETVEVAILGGEFTRGGRLPPERDLAETLGVSRLTLREGLNRLVGRGILTAVPGLGTYVSGAEMNRSVDLLAAEYQLEKVPQRKVELVRHYLETRRSLLSTVLAVAAERATDEQLLWIIDGFVRMAGTAQFTRDLRQTAEMEIRAIHIAAQKADLYHFSLMLNSLRHFFRVARDEIAAGARLEAYDARAEKLVELLRRRDGEGITRYVSAEYAPADRAQLAALERRLLKRRAPPPTSAPSHAGSSSSASGHSASTAPTLSSHSGHRQAARVEPGPLADNTQPIADADVSPPGPTAGGIAAGAENDPRPRTDPASWHRWFIDWYHRNFQCNPWDNPDEVPPGPTIDDERPSGSTHLSGGSPPNATERESAAPTADLSIAPTPDAEANDARMPEACSSHDPSAPGHSEREASSSPNTLRSADTAGDDSSTAAVHARAPGAPTPSKSDATGRRGPRLPSELAILQAAHAATPPASIDDDEPVAARPRPRDRDSP